MYLKRTIENFLQSATDHFPALLVTGPRQVGKTTILRHLSGKNRTYVTLDDPKLAALAKEEPALFLQRFTPPLLIDEIQYAPELLPYIKMHIDQHHKPGEFWLTGSQPFEMMKGVHESLAGRIGVVKLLGFSLQELQKQTERSEPFLPTSAYLNQRVKTQNDFLLQDIYRIIWRGSFPALWLQSVGDGAGNEDGTGYGFGPGGGAGEIDGTGYGDKVPHGSGVDHDLFYSSYVQTYLQRDVRDIININNTDRFLKFLRAAAARTGQLLNVAEIARDVGVSPMTATSWLSLLKMSGIIYLLEPYHRNITKRLIKTPKLYFLDTGLCAYLTEWSSPETLEAGAMSGAILETFVVAEILKSYWHHGKQAPLYFYRDKDQKEIDLLIVEDNTIYPVEIKKTAHPDKNSVQHFQVLRHLKTPIGMGGVLCLTSTLLPLTDQTNAIPIGYL
jgi:hypothetical protein